jgi:hypothetical protein
VPSPYFQTDMAVIVISSSIIKFQLIPFLLLPATKPVMTSPWNQGKCWTIFAKNEKSFTNIKKRKAWTKGRMVKQVDSIEEIIRARFGSEELLFPGDIPACVLCAAQHEDAK